MHRIAKHIPKPLNFLCSANSLQSSLGSVRSVAAVVSLLAVPQDASLCSASAGCFAVRSIEPHDVVANKFNRARKNCHRNAVPAVRQDIDFESTDNTTVSISARTAISQGSPRILDESQHSLRASSLPAYAWSLLTKLKLAGHDVFVVGGTVRDLLINQTPKDIDLTTTATLQQVKRLAGKCQIVGRRYPIALVHAAPGRIIEVSPFASSPDSPHDVAALAQQSSQGKLQPEHVDRSWSSVWQQNMQSRDFTVNALMYDPVSHLLYDYVGGFSDCHRRRLHSLGDPYVSLAEDPPRILRAIRLSARTGLQISSETEAAVKKLAPRLLEVNGGRLNGEAVSMFCFGASLRSIQLLWRLQALDVVLAPHASYLRLHNITRTSHSSLESIMQGPLLLRLLHFLDQQASVHEPVSMNVVTAILVAPIFIDAVTSHKDKLQAHIRHASTDTVVKRHRGNARGSNQLATKAQARAASAAIVDEALQRWQDRMYHQGIPQDARHQEMLFCLTVAATEFVRNKVPLGLLPKANASTAQHMLMSFWNSTLHKFQEGSTSDSDTAFLEHSRSQKPAKGKPGYYARRNQATLNAILHNAESSWLELLPSINDDIDE